MNFLIVVAQSTPPPLTAASNGAYIAWALALLGVAVTLFLVEVFVPSGGVLGLISTACLIGGVVLMFWEDTTFGLVTLIVVLLALPVAVGAMIRIMPGTPFIRALTLGDPEEGEDPDAAEAARGTPAPGPHGHPLVGKTGKAMTDLRPVGTVLIEGRREECLAVGDLVPAGTTVQVVSVDGLTVRVRPVA